MKNTLSHRVGDLAGSFAIAASAAPGGGPRLRATYLQAELFDASAMEVVEKNLMDMKVAELKEELDARGESKTGMGQ